METLGNLNLEKLKDQELEIVGMIEVDNRLGMRHLLENKPVVVLQSKHIEIKIPDDFSVDWLAKEYFKRDQKIQINNERDKILESIKFSELAKMFKQETPNSVFSFDLNLDDKKFSEKFDDKFDAPKVIREICSFDKQCNYTKRISITSRNSFTDFKISSSHLTEWYNVISGLIIVYLVEPTSHNVNVLNQWNEDENRHNIYLPEKFNTKCYSYMLKKTNTLFMPRHWIYAFFTYDNALIFHGEMITSSTQSLESASKDKKRKFNKTE